MAAVEMLFSTWGGILSVLTVVLATGFIVYMVAWAWRKSGEAQK